MAYLVQAAAAGFLIGSDPKGTDDMQEKDLWTIDSKGERHFVPGKNDPHAASLAARQCPSFLPDDEDGWISDEDVSFYNFIYRRFTALSFICCRPK